MARTDCARAVLEAGEDAGARERLCEGQRESCADEALGKRLKGGESLRRPAPPCRVHKGQVGVEALDEDVRKLGDRAGERLGLLNRDAKAAKAGVDLDPD